MSDLPASTPDAAPPPERSFALARRLWRVWIRPKWRLLAWGILLSLITAAAGSSYAGALHYAGELIKAAEPSAIWIAPAMFLVLGVIRSVSLYGQTLATNRLALSIMRDLQNALYAQYMQADFARIQSQSTGSIISRFTNDITMLRESLIRSANNLTRDLFMIIFGVAWMFWIDWALALFVLLVLPLAAQPVLRIGKMIRRRSDQVQTQMGDVTSFLEESVSGARMVKTFSLEPYAKERARARFQDRFTLLLSMTRYRAMIEPVMEVAGMIALAGVLALLAWRATTGESGIEDLLGIVGAVLVVSPAARALGSLSGVIQEGLAVVQRIFTVLDDAPRLVDRPGARALNVRGGAIEFRDVEFGYETGPAALSDISLRVPAGQTAALVGPSGSGKTSLLNLIPRLYDPRSGEVRIDGQDIAGVTLASLRGAVSLVSQDVTMFDDTVRANIAFGKLDATDEEIAEAACAADAHDFVTALEHGYETRVGPRGTALSGGQRQRIAIARAILKDAPILLLDEATSALDAQSEARVQAALERLSEGRTTLVIAHRLSTVREADQIFVMREGRIVETGTHDNLMAEGGLYADLSRLQLREPGGGTG
nr:ABC transporter ATP-binding protein [Marinicauda sp. Alg238-R41]